MLEAGQFGATDLARVFTFPFLHRDALDAVFSIVFVLAVGKAVAERLSGLTVVLSFVCASLATAMVVTLVLGPGALLIGAWAPVCGLIGALTLALWLQGKITGQPPMQAFSLIGALAAIQVLFWFIGGGLGLFELVVGFVIGLAVTAILHPAPGQTARHWLVRLRDRG